MLAGLGGVEGGVGGGWTVGIGAHAFFPALFGILFLLLGRELTL